MAETRPVVVDTSAFYALVSPTDRYHEQALATVATAIDEDHPLWTTSHVLVESFALIHRRLGFDILEEFLDAMTTRWPLNVRWVDAPLHEEAVRRLVERRGRGLSLVDWTVALASSELDASVFTFDSDFADAGMSVLPG